MPDTQMTFLDHNVDIWHPATQQRIFRRLMIAFAYPGRVQPLCAESRDALRAVLATLVDAEVGLADPKGLVAVDDWHRLEARRAAPEQANFIVACGDATPDFQPALGTLESPELGATLVLRVAALGHGKALHLSGPGIHGESVLEVGGLNAAWLSRRETWNGAFPVGVDMILVDDCRAAALPRTTRILIKGDR